MEVFPINEILNLQSSWDFFKNTKLPIVCYGTGNGADMVLDEFTRLGICVSAFAASDGFVRKRKFREFTVKSFAECEEEFGEFCVAVCFGSQIPEVMEFMKALAKKHPLRVPTVPVYGSTIFNKDFLKNNAKKFETIYQTLYDEKSKAVLLDFLRFQISGELSYLFRSETEKDEIFDSTLCLEEQEIYLDLGAYRGDTIQEFLHYTHDKYEKIYAVEPDEKTFKKLEKNVKHLTNTNLYNVGIWSKKAEVAFSAAGGRNSTIQKEGKKIPVESVDSLLDGNKITYLKADVEGAELNMLEGAKETLKTYKPKLNIAAYHKTEDLITLLPKILEIRPDYRLYLRHHPYIPCWDLNIYGI